MTFQTLKIFKGWDWQPLWEAIETGHHEFPHDFVTRGFETDIRPKVIMAARFIR